jgi:hypothetical protein
MTSMSGRIEQAIEAIQKRGEDERAGAAVPAATATTAWEKIDGIAGLKEAAL